MASYANEIKLLTIAPACRRLAEIADQLKARLDDIEQRCCHQGTAARPDAPAPATPPTAG